MSKRLLADQGPKGQVEALRALDHFRVKQRNRFPSHTLSLECLVRSHLLSLLHSHSVRWNRRADEGEEVTKSAHSAPLRTTMSKQEKTLIDLPEDVLRHHIVWPIDRGEPTTLLAFINVVNLAQSIRALRQLLKDDNALWDGLLYREGMAYSGCAKEDWEIESPYELACKVAPHLDVDCKIFTLWGT